jgi:hypothetical protein
VPWAAIIKFNVDAIATGDFYEAVILALEWWNCDPVPVRRH